MATRGALLNVVTKIKKESSLKPVVSVQNNLVGMATV